MTFSSTILLQLFLFFFVTTATETSSLKQTPGLSFLKHMVNVNTSPFCAVCMLCKMLIIMKEKLKTAKANFFYFNTASTNLQWPNYSTTTLTITRTYQVDRYQRQMEAWCVSRENLCFYSYLLLAAEVARPALNSINFNNCQSKHPNFCYCAVTSYQTY